MKNMTDNDSTGKTNKQKQSQWHLVPKRTIPTESMPLVGEVGANV
jgi:hypothetical protein